MSRAGATASFDLREGGRWTHAQAAKNGLVYALISVVMFVVRPVPRRWLRAIGRFLGASAFYLVPHLRRIALANVARAVPALAPAARRALVQRTYAALGEYLGDSVALLHGDERALLRIDAASLRLFDEARAGGNGVLFASAHLGPWEGVAATLVKAGLPLTTLARESYDPRLTRVYDRLRRRHGVLAIYRGTRGSAARIVRTLRSGRVLGAPMDLRSRVPSILAPFLGHPAPTAVGPARIALRTGARVIVGTAARNDDGTLCVTATPIRTDDLRADSDGERVLTTRINDEISRRILAFPEGWPWMHERWASPAASA